ncbi:DNA polymerase III subunit beta [bacterium]|nr:DNA polymerase III subunit beta [bacterium]
MMKLRIGRLELDKALGVVSRAVSMKSLGSYQQFVKIAASSDGIVSLEATDDELYTRVSIEGSVTDEGETLVSPLICDLVSRMIGDEVEIFKEGASLTVKCGRSRYQLVCAPADHFPKISDYKTGQAINMQSSVLRDVLSKITFCAYKGGGERSSYYTSGVLFRFTPEYLDAVATDGHRLGLKKCRGKFTEETVDVMLPASNAEEIMKFLPDDPELTVSTFLSNNQLFLEFENMVVASSLLDVKFPDYSRVIPSEKATTVSIDRKEMHDALRRAIIVSRAKQHNPVARLKTVGDVMTIFTDATDVGSGEEDLPCEVTGDDIEISLNPGYLVDVLSQLSCEGILFYWNSKVTPLVVSTSEDEDYTYVVMPIRIE